MADQPQTPLASDLLNENLNKPIGAREFILRYLKYVPWVVISVALFFFIAFLKIRWSVPIYKVQSSLLINNDRSSVSGSDERLGELFMNQPPANMNNETEILKSRPLIQRVVRDLGLEKRYFNRGNVRSTMLYNSESPFQIDFLPPGPPNSGLQLDVIILNEKEFTINKSKKIYRFGEPFPAGGTTCLLTRNPYIPLANFAEPKFQVRWEPTASVAEEMIGSLKIAPAAEYATILSITLETENIPQGKDVLNTIMAVYDTMIIEDKNRIANNTLKFIESRRATLEQDLRGVEGGMRDFMEKSQAFDLPGQSKLYSDNLSGSTKALTEQGVHMSILQYLLEYIDDPHNKYELVPTNLGIMEPVLAQYVGEYNNLQTQRYLNLQTTTENNTLIIGLNNSLDRVRENMRQALLSVKKSYEIEGNSLVEKNKELEGKIKSLPGKSMQAVTIERHQRILEELYSFLLKKGLETSLSSASTISNSRVIEPAIGSNNPIKPNHSSLYSTYLIFGLVIPIGIIAIFELLSDKVNNRVEIEKATRAPILGEIGHSDDTQALIVTRNSRKFIAEQFRIIRTNLQYVIGKNERPVIMVTSSFSGEGKSFVSTNIGAVMALSGKKTVIMEFDIRKPKILSGLELKKKMGITNYIIGKAKFEDLPVQVEGIENLFVIPCGPIPPNPAELLLDTRLGELIRQVKEHFEVVIMDTAPVGLVSDAVNLGKFADCTLYIVRRGHTVRRLLGLVEDLYQQKKLPSISLLFNDIKLEGGYYGGYYGGYGYYGYGYGHEGGYFEKEETGKIDIIKGLKRWWARWFS